MSNLRINPHLCARGGFSLLEILIAVSIIGIVFTTVFRLHLQTITMNNAARFYTDAPLLAQQKLSEIQIRPDERRDGAGDFGDDFAGYQWTVTVGDVESELLGEKAKTLKRIDLTVTLNHDEYTYGLRTYQVWEED